jgi:tetratricopeptide (TPR) repeat protein
MPAPDFALADVREPGGKRHGPGTYRGKPLFLHFASPACGVCNAEGEAVRRAEKLVAERGARFLHVIADPDGDGAAARAFAERLRFGAPAVRADERVVLAYNLIHKHLWNRRRNLGVPTTFLLDEDGAVVKAYRGQAGPEEMARDLERLPRTPEARRELALPFPGRLLKHAFARDPLGLGNAYYEAGLHDLASAVFAGGSAANDADTLFNYALASAQGGRTAEAEAAYRRVLELAPALDEARNNLGTLLARAGRVAEAREVFREIVTRNPAHAEAVLNLGNALLAEDRIAEVAETYRRALVHDPESAAFHRQLGYALYRLGDREAAIGEYTRAAAIDPLDHEATLGLAIVLLATGRAAEAKQAAESGLEREPSHAHLLNARAMACAGLGESREAIAALEKAIAADPAFDRPYLNLARLLADEGRREEAAAVLRRLLAAVPGHEPGRQLLAEVE